ncbi:UPF0175 family protein [Curtanaerobium respiraculi]|uniref:UPF0175 family protein n=1 Tax=Curtanaerobium respiraculi TaxID=2949669 RepID=UPI0024B3C3C0|nr:UPF0175 family protein [Curtanaerobium respiraculi]
MCTITMTMPDEALKSAHMSMDEARALAQRYTAMGWYLHGGFSVGYCAALAQMPEADFIRFLGENHISIFDYASEDQLLAEVANA